MRKLLFACLSIIVVCSPVWAQEITGVIRGTVKDPSGAVVPNAVVTVTNTDRNQVIRKISTNNTGEYVAPLLPVGHYTVTIEAPGFKKFTQTAIELNVNDRLTVDAALQTGNATETVNVEADPLQVNLQSATQEGLISGTQVRQLPLNNRNYEQLVTLQPGVTSNAADSLYVGVTNPSGGVNVVSFSVNGNRNSGNNWTIDGADNVDHGSNLTLLVYPSVDGIGEFKVLRSNYNPEFGRSSSGQINVVTRAGSSSFHGSLYEFFRNDVLNANNALNNHVGKPKDVLRYNDFGGTFGGPFFIPGVYNTNKDKTFFFFSEEVRRVTTPVRTVSTIPTTAELGGTFPVPVCVAIDATGACTATGTQITTVNPIAAAYIQDIFSKVPPPGPDGTLVSTAPGVFNYREELIRVDHVVNQKLALMGRFINDSIPTTEPFGIFGPQSNLPGVANTKTNSPGRQVMGRATMQFNDHTLNEVGYAYSYGAIVSDPTGLLARQNAPNVVNAINLPYTSTLNRVPNVFFDDGFDGIAGFGQYRDYNRNHNVFDNFAYSRGTHSFRFGFTYNHYQKKENAAGDNVGNYFFDSTNAPASDDVTARLQDWANFLLGFASDSFVQSPVDTTADIRQNLYEAYGQDEWRIRPNFTLSYGVRYSYFPTPYGANKNLTTFDPSVFNPAAAPLVDATGSLVAGTGNPLNGVIVGGVASPYGRYITRQDKTNFAPRIGIAWDPFKDGKTSIRGGYGIFYDAVAAGLIEDNVFNNPPFISGANFGPLTNISTAGSAGALSSTIPPGLWTTDPRWTTPYSQQWNLDLQQEMGRGFIIDIGYVGNKGTHLVGVRDINQVAPGAVVAAGLAAPGELWPGGTASGRKLNALRPFRGWSSIGQIAPVFNSNYHALQTSLEKRFGSNTLLNISYTWSHALTDNQTDRSSGLQNTFCQACDYGRSQLDRRHVFTANYVWDMPWLRNAGGAKGVVLGGWQLSGILTVNSGLPFTVFSSRAAGDPAASGLNSDGPPNNGRPATPRPNQIGNPNIDAPKTWDAWFNAAAFTDPTTAQPFGGTARRGAVNGPGLWRYDMSLMKAFRITERSNLQFRAEAFNLFNHTNFQSIGTTRGTGTYNSVTAVRDPRIVQLALKFQF